MKLAKLFPVLVLFSILASCTLTPFGEDAPEELQQEETAVIEEESSLYEEDDCSGKFVFETNDTRYLNDAGYTVWTTNHVNESDGFEPITVSLSKESGRSEAGYGIVFCSREIDGKPFLLTVLINTMGMYTAGKVVDGVFSHINGGWKSSAYINRGYGTKNLMTVSYDSGKKNFLLSINGYDIAAFTAPEKMEFKDSRSGFVVGIAGNEDLPRTPVKVSFEKKESRGK